MTRRSPAALLCLLLLPVALLLSACGSKEDDIAGTPQTQKLTLMLDYFPNADHAGIYAAQASGAFAKVGLDVDIQTPSDPSAPLKLVEAGRADLAISYEPELLLARDKGAKLVAVGAIVNKPLTSLMALGKEKITRVEDLRGKTVGTAGIPYQAAYLKTILEEAGVPPEDVKTVDVGFNLVPAMISGKVDATLGAFWNYEGTQLQREKKDPDIIRMETVGVPTYDELVVVASEETTKDRGALVRRFFQALRQGTEQVRADPAAGVTPLLKANPDLDRGLQEAVVRKTLPVFFPADDEDPFGYMDPSQWRAYGRWMLDRGLITKEIDPTSLTNEFLPGAPIGNEREGLD
ncbi:ABC transporter substrate-binding protein [Paraconexibacter algicola]|uniref:ABC transporter substrate-binding protein n=1 Tax=Paraconexibacter algicola TaxID=2133960 RepID=A0A2T4UFI9_9ACTN|nr:ABC transporter substrate-binding protein [Paraconexibacter algicola]PTL56554.1 ABC transporter substrate-binding protein [Paraconexibacter algicola]